MGVVRAARLERPQRGYALARPILACNPVLSIFLRERKGGCPWCSPVAAATTDNVRPWAAQTIAVALRMRTSGGEEAWRQSEDRHYRRRLHAIRPASVRIRREKLRLVHQPPARVSGNRGWTCSSKRCAPEWLMGGGVPRLMSELSKPSVKESGQSPESAKPAAIEPSSAIRRTGRLGAALTAMVAPAHAHIRMAAGAQ